MSLAHVKRIILRFHNISRSWTDDNSYRRDAIDLNFLRLGSDDVLILY